MKLESGNTSSEIHKCAGQIPRESPKAVGVSNAGGVDKK
jgi:hypothetical protein